jgi:phage baseplate assembly protein W
MPSLTFTGLQKIQITTKNYTYSDLHLDFTNPISKDLTSDYDVAAVKNSLTNLFNTIPGQNLLNPIYGLNLVRFLFEPLNEVNGRLIGNAIVEGITTFEPRVIIRTVDVEVNEDEQTYYITLNILIPILDAEIEIPGTLSKTGFTLN